MHLCVNSVVGLHNMIQILCTSLHIHVYIKYNYKELYFTYFHMAEKELAAC